MGVNFTICRIFVGLHLGGYRRWDALVRSYPHARYIALYGFRSALILEYQPVRWWRGMVR